MRVSEGETLFPPVILLYLVASCEGVTMGRYKSKKISGDKISKVEEVEHPGERLPKIAGIYSLANIVYLRFGEETSYTPTQ